MKLVNWNLNSIRSRIEYLRNLLKQDPYDLVLLQELKCENHNFPDMLLEEFCYNYAINHQKSYNGVAIFSKHIIDDIKYSFPNQPRQEEARFVEISLVINNKYYTIISVYVPNGAEVGSEKYEFKLDFMRNLTSYVKSINKSDERLLIAGDFNIALNPIDVYDSKSLENSLCYSLEERKTLQSFLNETKLHDCYRCLNPDTHQYSWWDYRKGAFDHNKGLRIDYIFANSILMDELKSCEVRLDVRALDKASDHAPIIAEFV